jgi:tetratricopeptide (TPR) repeat protein
MIKRKNTSNKIAPQVRSGNFFPSSPRLLLLAAAALIAVAVFLAYQQSINGGFVLDDDLMITENPNIKAADGPYRFWCTTKEQDYWPLTYTAFWMEWRLWGRNPTGYHLTSLILHIVETLLIWIILRKLCIPGAFLAALIFAIHPVNVESVAWIAEQKNTMTMLFFLLSILWYLKAVIHAALPAARAGAATASLAPRPSPFWYWLSLTAFALAMLSKGSAAVLPVLLLGIVWWLRPLGTAPISVTTKIGPSPSVPISASTKMELWPSIRRDLLWIAPFFAIALSLAGVNVWFQTHGGDLVYRTAGFTERSLGAGAVVWFYLYEALMPVDLYFIYPMWHIQTGNWVWWLPFFAVLIVTAVLWWNRKGWSRPFLFAWGFFCVSLAPVAGFADVGFMRYSLVADRYQHIAIIGLIALVASGWSLWHRRIRNATRWIAIAAALAAVGALALLTWRQNGIYRTETILYRATLEKNPDCWMVHNNLGFMLAVESGNQGAIGNSKKAANLNQEAIGHFQKAADLKKEAIEHFQQAVDLNPNYPDAQNNLGNLIFNAGRVKEAEEHLRQALRVKPNYPQASYNLGNLLFKTDRPREAMEQFRQALQYKPDYLEARRELGNVLLNLGRLQEAIEQYRQALDMEPDNPDLHNNIGVALFQINRLHEAMDHYRQALRLKPDFADGYLNMALVHARLRQSSEALASARKALAIARSQGQTALAKKTEDWLNSYRAGPSGSPNITPPSK